MRASLVGLAAGLAVLSSASAANASPEDIFGYGGRTSAMGATGVAHASGYESAWHDPALAAPVGPNQAYKLTLGYGASVFRLDAAGPGLPGRVSAEAAKGFLIGAELPLPFGGVLTDRLGIALGFYTPSDVIVRGRVLYPETTQFPLLPDRAESLMIRGALGANIGWGIKAGIGFAALAEIVGTVVAATDATGRVGTRVEDQLVATYAPVFGATWDLPEQWKTNLRLGVAYRGTLDARFAVIVDGTKLSSLQIPLFNISGLAQYDPAQYAFEIARREAKNTLAVQLGYKRWGDFPGVLEPTVVCNEGGAGACGIVPPTIPWKDTFVVRVGAEQGFAVTRGATLHARAGGFFEKSPLPDELPGSEAFSPAANGVVTVPTRYFDSDRVAFTVGTGLSLADPLPPIDLDLWGQYHVLLPRTIRSNDQEGESSGWIGAFGMTAGVRF
jgi:long-chain fatty acid transport protein